MEESSMRPHLVTFALIATSFGSVLSDGKAYAQVDAPAPKVGLLINDPRASQGYTLIAPMTAKETYLLDMQGRVVQTWRSDWQPALSAYLLENGNLLRSGGIPPQEQPFGGPGAGGRIQQFSWDGQLVWDFKLVLDRQLPHHDITPLPNGNVLLVAWDKKNADEAIAAGRRKELISKGQVLSDCILEIKPTGKTTGEIVWRWNVWDHLIQDHDPAKANYGDVSAHPELIDVNLDEEIFGRSAAGVPDYTIDWTHINSVAYNAELDQIALSVRAFNEIWIIDHRTTTAEAAGHEGGQRGKGGDLLYRWGNPRTYGRGKIADQRLFKQHDAHWIPTGLPGAGNILLFNNGNNRLDGAYSTVDEIVTPINEDGHYALTAGAAFAPDEAVWSYAAPNKEDFFSKILSGAQRLPNGNTLICSGANGTVLEVTREKELVWKYVNPVMGSFTGYRLPGDGPVRVGRGGLPAINNALFRVHRYSPDFPGFHGKDLKPGKLLEEQLR
jgi:hypothetical protein